MDKVAWKAYEEVDFSNKYILRWVREGDEYVNKITKEMMEDLKSVVRQQQAEIEALKMGFANSGTHDSELAETRAMAGRLFLKVQDLEFEQEGYENLTEMLESEKAELTEKNCQQQAEIEALKAKLAYMFEQEIKSAGAYKWTR